MTARSKAVAALVLGGLAALFLVANVVLVWNVDAAASAGRPPAATLWLLGLAAAPVVGAIIAGKRPDNPYGWLLLSFGLTSALLELTELYALFALGAGGVAGDVVEGVVLVTVSVIFAAMLPAAASLFVRRRRATPQERLQLRWFSWAAAVMAVALLVGASGAIDSEDVTNAILMAGFMGLFGAIGVAASTLVAAAVIGPARVRIQRIVDRRFNRARYDAARAVHAYRARLRDEIELEAVSEGLLAEVDETVQPRGVQLWLWRPEQVTS